MASALEIAVIDTRDARAKPVNVSLNGYQDGSPAWSQDGGILYWQSAKYGKLGADGEPLFKDVMVALAEDQADATPRFAAMPKVVGGRYGLGSKEFTPGMVRGVFTHLNTWEPQNHFTVGIIDRRNDSFDAFISGFQF